MIRKQQRMLRFRPPLPVDLDRTLKPFARGRYDPCVRRDAHGSWWRALWTPEGPATLRVARDGDHLSAEAWGPGSDWALSVAPDWVGARDSLAGFAPEGRIREMHERHPGLRIPRANTVYQCALLAVLEQKVVGMAAARAYRGLVARFGEPAPGPGELRLPPPPERLAATAYFELHELGVERRRAETLRRVARYARRLEETLDLPVQDARRRLAAIDGIGPWTIAEIMRIAHGDPDALSVGDYHLPSVAAYTLLGQRQGDDALLLSLLEPYAGHRGRVQRLLEVAGDHPPRRGPRLAPALDTRRRSR